MVWGPEDALEEVAYALWSRLLWQTSGRRAPGRAPGRDGLLRPPDSLVHAIDSGDLGGFVRAIDSA